MLGAQRGLPFPMSKIWLSYSDLIAARDIDGLEIDGLSAGAKKYCDKTAGPAFGMTRHVPFSPAPEAARSGAASGAGGTHARSLPDSRTPRRAAAATEGGGKPERIGQRRRHGAGQRVARCGEAARAAVNQPGG